MSQPDEPESMSLPQALSVRNVSIRHDERTANTPESVSFDVAAGEVVLLLGPSGSGKSTLALALNGLVPHAISATLEGEILVNGQSTRDATVGQLSSRVAMVFQDPDAQLVTGTVLDEVCFGPENLRVATSDVLDRAERALRQVGLWERRAENPDRLSGGGRQRLAIACALALGSPVLVLDEPTANLDPAGIDEVYAVLSDLVRDREHSIVLIEHNLDAAVEIVDRVVVIDGAGHLAFDGPTRDVLLGHVDDLLALGVWLPVATLAAVRLRSAGVHLDPLPLSPRELTRALDAQELVPELAAVPERPGAAGVAAGAVGAVGAATPSNDLAVTVRDLTVLRRKNPILRGVTLDVERGSFLAIVGTNGAGKTTLLQAIAGVVAPPRGRIRIGGLDPATASPSRLARAVGFVFQNPEHQFLRGNAEEELTHGLTIQGMTATASAAPVERMLRRFGLDESRLVHPFLLSGGQKRRLSVGTALIAGAPILALDEPTFGQDRERADELLAILEELRSTGTTIIVVTHDMQLVADHATHIAILREGSLVATGPADEILAGDALEQAGLRLPPLARAMRALTRHPTWRGISRLQDLPGARR